MTKSTTTTTTSKKDTTFDPRTPVVVAQTKTIDTTAAECADMNQLLQRLEWGKVDLQSQLDILASDNILCGLRKLESSGLQPKKEW